MKTFVYEWVNEIYLLHTQINCEEFTNNSITITRVFNDGTRKSENTVLPESSHRFIISRTHPSEISVIIEYPLDSTLILYEITDRAYYPVNPFFEG